MEQLVRIRAIAAPMLRANIDTDQIIPARFLVRTSEAGLGEGLFADLRSRSDGSPDPDFVLNRPPFDKAEILLADRNFGCGSSREGAPKALREKGFRVVIAPSFGGIFFSNCFRNGILPLALPIENVRALAAEAAGGGANLTVDLEEERVRSDGGIEFRFQTPKLLRRMLLEGQDEIAVTLSHAEQIGSFRSLDSQRRPWVYAPASAIG